MVAAKVLDQDVDLLLRAMMEVYARLWFQFVGPNGETFTLGGQLSWFDHPTAPARFVVASGEYTNGHFDATTEQITEDRWL